MIRTHQYVEGESRYNETGWEHQGASVDREENHEWTLGYWARIRGEEEEQAKKEEWEKATSGEEEETQESLRFWKIMRKLY